MINDEQTVEEISKAVKNNGDISAYKKDRKLSPFLSLIHNLNSMPKKQVPQFNFSRIRNQILDRISIPALETKPSRWSMFSFVLAGVGSLLIIVSLTLGLAVTALNSVPGQAVYPLKKIVENVQLKFAPQDQKADLQLKFAETRAEEIQSVLEKQQQGQLTQQQATAIVATTVQDIKQSTAAAAQSASQQPNKSAIVSKLSDVTDKLKAASIKTEGQIKLDIDSAVQNIETTGDKVDGTQTATSDNNVTASGKLTTVSETSISIGTAKFLITKDTVYNGVDAKTLAIDQVVDIVAQIQKDKTVATSITLVSDAKDTKDTDTKTDTSTTKTETPATPPPAAAQ